MDAVQDEIIAIQSIFGEEIVEHDASANELKICIPSIKCTPRLELHVFLPQVDLSYPSSSPPVFELCCDLFSSSTLFELAATMEEMFQPGEVILYTWIAFLQEEWEQRKPPPPPAEVYSDASLATRNAEQKDDAPILNEESAQHLKLMRQIAAKIVHGEPLTEKKSTFQAHVVPITDPSEIPSIMEFLLQNKKIRAATHNIMAYRIEGSREGTFFQDSDDDGESAAGGRLLHLLQMVDARNVVVVVSRWFGGTLLGPARFGLINKAARELLDSQGMIRSGGGGSNSGK
jgi:Uncharacterized protein family UPF0029/RWD domain